MPARPFTRCSMRARGATGWTSAIPSPRNSAAGGDSMTSGRTYWRTTPCASGPFSPHGRPGAWPSWRTTPAANSWPTWRLQIHFQLPDDLRSELGRMALVIVKGDANYRRLLGDGHWPPTTPFEKVPAYFPVPLVALRTLKAELIVGLQPGEAERLQAVSRLSVSLGRPQPPDRTLHGHFRPNSRMGHDRKPC